MAILRNLTCYLWPSDNPGLRARVVTALGLLVASKALNIQVYQQLITARVYGIYSQRLRVLGRKGKRTM